MPYSSFQEILAKLQQSNIGEGYVMAGKAEMMLNQDEALRNTLALFNKKELEYNKDILTTDEQLKKINESSITKEGTKSIEETAQEFQTLLDLSLKKQQELSDFYKKTQQDLISIGSEESIMQANLLEKGLTTKLANWKERAELPLKRIEFNKNMLNISILKTNDEQSALELQKYKSDLQVMEGVAEALSITDTKTGKNFWNSIIEKAGFNADTGQINFKKELETFYKAANEYFEANPKFVPIKDKIIQALDLMISQRIRSFNPPEQPVDYTGIERLQKDAIYTTELYNWLKNTSKTIATIENDSWYSDVRSLYKEYVSAYLKEHNIKEDSPEAQELFKFASNKKINDKILKDLRDNNIEVSEDTKKSFQEAIQNVYNFKYNNDPDNDKNYWKQLEIFKKKLNISKINPIPEVNLTELSDEQKENLKPIIETKGKIYGKSIALANLMGQTVPFDLSVLLSNDSGYWDYYGMKAKGKLETYQDLMYEKTPAPGRSETSNKLVNPLDISDDRTLFPY